MRGIRSVGLCAAAVLGLCGLFAGAASAETLPAPYWAACVKTSPKDTGKYKNKTCTEADSEGKGEYELAESVGKGKVFKGASAKKDEPTLVVKDQDGEQDVVCKSAKFSGKPEKPNLVIDVSITYSKCIAVKSLDCNSAGAKAEEIKVTGVQGVLGYVEEGVSPVVGLRLESEKEPGVEGTVSDFECGESPGHPPLVTAKVVGQYIGVVKGDVGTISKSMELDDEATERYGTHEYDEEPFKPSVHILGWAPELAEIEACSGKECVSEHPAHVIKGQYCGPYVEDKIGKECTPPAYSGEDQVIQSKGEALEIKT
jgi:hypothetical protein